jgi:RNA polymerase sigma-70 factor (ECF subfamily)
MPRSPALPFDHAAALAACARGERFALRALYEEEGRWLLGVALRILRNRAAAEDALQEAFLQIWRSAGQYQAGLGSARGWVYTLVRNRALNEARRSSRQVDVDDEGLERLIDIASLGQAGDADRDRADAESLDRCLQALDEPKRQCIVHAYLDGYTHEQIAERLATPLGTVKSWIRRGLLSLKACLS